MNEQPRLDTRLNIFEVANAMAIKNDTKPLAKLTIKPRLSTPMGSLTSLHSVQKVGFTVFPLKYISGSDKVPNKFVGMGWA